MRAAVAVLASAVLLTGCGAEEDGVRALVEQITVEANERDADAVRTRVDDLLVELDDAVRAGELSEDEATAVRERALAVQAGADAIDPDVVARREAEQAAQEAQARLEAERAEAERVRAEQEAAARAEAEQRGKDEGKDDDGGKDDGKGDSEDDD